MEFIYKKNIPVDREILIGVYFLFKKDKIVYVGQSQNIKERINTHKKNKLFDCWNYIEVLGGNINEIEADYILKYNPIYNKSIHTNTKWISLSTCSQTIKLKKKSIYNHIESGYFSKVHLFCNKIYLLKNETLKLHKELELCKK